MLVEKNIQEVVVYITEECYSSADIIDGQVRIPAGAINVSDTQN